MVRKAPRRVRIRNPLSGKHRAPQGPCRCQAGSSARWTISSGLCATVTRSSRPISASMVSDVAGVSGRWSPASRSFSVFLCPDLVGADLSHYRIYLVGPLLGAMVAVGFEFILRGKATKAGGEAAQGILDANPEGI